MRILLIAPILARTGQEEEMLDMRGYDVLTFAHLCSAEYPHNAGCTPSFKVVRMHIALELIGGRIPVLHPEAPMELARIVAGTSTALAMPLLHLQELPAIPPASTEVIDALNVAASYLQQAATAPLHLLTPQSMAPWRERWATLKKRWLRWERRFNDRYGDLLKNPVSRRMHTEARTHAHVPYKAPDNPATTTG